jgi:glycosyltransferase involved in cell wall biosynthesis
MNLNILTRCTRLNYLSDVKKSIFTTNKFEIKWWLIFDTRNLKEIDIDFLESLQHVNCQVLYYKGDEGDFGHQLINKTIDQIKDGFVYMLDDDNIIHEDFYENLHKSINENPDKKGFIFSQQVDGRDFTKLDIRIGSPQNTKVSHIDMAQFVLDRDLIGSHRIDPMNYIADGMFIEKIYNENKDKFFFIDKVLCHYNYLSKDSGWVSSPRILYIGDDKPELKSTFYPNLGETDHLKVEYRTDDLDLQNVLNTFNPNAIIVTGNMDKGKNVVSQPPDIRRRSIYFDKSSQSTGESAYQVAMNWILDHNRKDTVSYFTPVYNTGEKIKLAYQSLVNQTWNNWEWVIVNDSTDGGKTLKIVEDLASKDNRIKLHDFRKKSGGVVGESKYRAATLCGGEILAELDHDDYLMPDCTEMLLKASQKYPEAGFFYTDCVEMNHNWESPQFYGEGFGLGYGKYKQEMHLGIMMNVVESSNINPKTIRHIVGVPNHVRAWRRKDYMRIGGHNRNLTIADDYELIIRTFLETIFVRIPKLGYLQFIHENGSNTHKQSIYDIQRRVRTISNYYNLRIKDRFHQLGVNDWAFQENPHCPWMSESRFGDAEEKVNIIYQEESINQPPEDQFETEYII